MVAKWPTKRLGFTRLTLIERLPDLPDAACIGMDTEWWFSTSEADQRRARAVCAGCPERARCLEFALSERIGVGMWGGADERDRERIPARRAEVSR